MKQRNPALVVHRTFSSDPADHARAAAALVRLATDLLRTLHHPPRTV